MTSNSEERKFSESLRHSISDRVATVFAEPWEAQAFAIVITLSDNGYFTWGEWANTLAETISRSKAKGGPTDGSDYYLNWIIALEEILQSKGLADSKSLKTVKAEWEQAYKLTPHGKPVSLNR